MLARMVCIAALIFIMPTSAPADETPTGAAAPDITLADGSRQFRLSDAAGKYVALHLLLPAECPYCVRQLAEYEMNAPAVAGVMHVFIKQGPTADFAAWRDKLTPQQVESTLVFPDPENSVARAFGVPDGYEFYGHNAHYPALIVLGPDQRELFRHVGRNNADRLPFSQFAAQMADATRDPAFAHFNVVKGKPAIDGHDPVSYFNGSPRQGSPDFASSWRGVTYHCSDDANRRAFAADPARYVPAYGGWCATAMAEGGRKVEIDPGNYKVTDGRLFLFYKGWKGDALKEWNKDEPTFTRKADAAWKRLMTSAR